ncbi:MAG: bifunctional phosphoglucose/phosphomannose isomerase [Actinomycetia bacterium]|nr:bifunctional phosphoglucose/phosphomannose isomerase [Actinomycetes bacterium]
MTKSPSRLAEMRFQMTALSAQLRWGTNLELEPVRRREGELLVCGMGGSGISGDFLQAVAAAEGRRTTVHKHYGLPGWAPSLRPSVVAVSYSGNTAETLSSWEEARKLGLQVTAITSGGELAEMAALAGEQLVVIPRGYQPRSALGFGLSALLRVAAQAGAISDPQPSLEEAAHLADSLSGPKGEGIGFASELASAMGGRMVGVYGSVPLTQVAAYRWKTQTNENAKRSAFWSVLPETTHNEIVGWDLPQGLARRRVGIVALRDRDEHPGVSRRFEVLEKLTADRVTWVGEVWTQGFSPLGRLISLVAMGDLFSLELARNSGADPMAVDLIDRLKEEMHTSADSAPEEPSGF